MLKFKTYISEDKPGLWANIRARRAAGKPKLKPGDKNYPKTLDIESHDPKHVKQAIGVASDPRYKNGNMTGATKVINKLSKGLSDHPQVAAVLRRQNEAYNEPQGQAKSMMSPLQKIRIDKEKADRDRDGKLKPGIFKVKKEETSINEEMTFRVDIEGLPSMFMYAAGPGALKANLRKIVKQPSMITSVKRVTSAVVKKTFRLKAQGRDDDGDGEVDESNQPEWGTDLSTIRAKSKTPGQ